MNRHVLKNYFITFSYLIKPYVIMNFLSVLHRLIERLQQIRFPVCVCVRLVNTMQNVVCSFWRWCVLETVVLFEERAKVLSRLRLDDQIVVSSKKHLLHSKNVAKKSLNEQLNYLQFALFTLKIYQINIEFCRDS